MSTAQQNIAWVKEHNAWKRAVGNWKTTVERTCNVSDADEYWRNAFTCADVSGVTCQNGDASQVEIDSMNCPMTVCSDGLYTDQMAFLVMWQHNLKSHETMMSIHANQLVDCVCAARKCMDSDPAVLEAWNSHNLKYSELSIALMEAKGEIEELQNKSEDWTSLNEKYAAVLEASQLIENLQNQSQAWEAQSQEYSALKTDMMAANEKINKLESQSAVWDAQGESYSTLSSEMLDTKEKIKQLQDNSEEKYSDLSNAMSKVNKQVQTLESKNEGPQLHYYESTLTWESSKAFCEERSRTICKYDQICPMSNGGRRLTGSVKHGDHWAPILDATNDWVQVGDGYETACLSHNELLGERDWGKTTVDVPYKGYVYCCETDVTYHYIGKSATYNSSMEFCEDQGRRLCDSSEVCKSNQPVKGLVNGDKWIAVRDKFNDWMQIGNSGGRTCNVYGHRYEPPDWGVREDGSLIDILGYVYCCNM